MRFLLFIFLLFAFGCKEKDTSTPEGILKEDTMVNLLVDIHVGQAKVGLSNLPEDSSRIVNRQLEDSIYAKHQITRDDFNKSYRYYLHEVKKMDELYVRVIDTLGLREAEAQAKNK